MPIRVTKSYEKFNYLLRPSKQVERKLFIETLHHLRDAEYPIYEYTYLGLGSIFYADFVMFHKYLYIDRMICAEWADIGKRMRFNKPFDFVKLRMKPVSDLISRLGRKTRYLVWVDYDRPIDPEILQDIDGFAQVLAPGSVLLITVEAEPRLEDEDFEELSAGDKEERLFAFFQEEFGSYFVKEIRRRDLSRNGLPLLISKILRSQIDKSLVSRPALAFHQLFNFVYADGAQMCSIGGIVDDKGAEDRLSRAGIFELPHVRTATEEPELISVPPLTAREKEWIDSRLSSGPKRIRKNLGMDDQLLRNYVKFYKYYPTYYETLI